MTRYSFSVCLPPKGCSPNGGHGHWRTASRARKEFKSDCLKAILVEGLPPTFQHAVVGLTVYCGRKRVSGKIIKDGRYRPRDRDNAIASCKGLIDALTQMKAWPDDSAKHVRYGNVEIIGEKDSRGRAEIVVDVSEEA